MKIEINKNSYSAKKEVFIDGKEYMPVDSVMSYFIQRVISGSILIDGVKKEGSSVDGVERYTVSLSVVRKS